MKYCAFFLFFLLKTSFQILAQKTPFELGNGNQTTTYQECIKYYKDLASKHKEISLVESGLTDIGLPLHTVIVDKNGFTSPEKIKATGRLILFVNNGIHPGEPEGIDASMMLARDLVQKTNLRNLLNQVSVVIIPVYNVDGMQRRGKPTRANQNGPEAYGFRGNAQNRDLNRDFIKLDTENAKSFARIFTSWQPNILIDTHTSNGADYQYVITYIETQKDKLTPELAKITTKLFTPELLKHLSEKGFPMVPYVNSDDEFPDNGILGFLESPRYATGYAALFNTIGYTIETHMLKAYTPRVWATYHFLEGAIQIMHQNSEQLKLVKLEAEEAMQKSKSFTFNHKLDKTKADSIWFKGYAFEYKTSEVTGKERLFYNTEKPFEKNIAFFNNYQASDSAIISAFYYLPAAYKEVAKMLQLNGIKVDTFKKETKMQVELQTITNYQTSTRAYEGHYLHYNTITKTDTAEILFFPGDFLIASNQFGRNFLAYVLEPRAQDSYFNWNFFDGILQQKEYFSAYIFEDYAAEMLKNNPSLKKEFENKKLTDQSFKDSPEKQLDWLYKKSPFYEGSVNIYPVYKSIGK